eukprot:6071013-Lingulodinium_polyedra.AAC.1
MASRSHRSPCSWPSRASTNGAFGSCASMAGSLYTTPPPGHRSGRTGASGTLSSARTHACHSASPGPTFHTSTAE